MSGATSAHLAGWVFADALLALTLVGLATGTVSEAAKPAPPTPVVRAAPRPARLVVQPSPRPAVAVAQDPVVFDIAVGNATEEQVRARVGKAVAGLAANHRRAAFVLTFGTATAPSAGTALARRVNSQLDAAAPSVFHGAAKRDFWKAVNAASPSPGTTRLELYLIQI